MLALPWWKWSSLISLPQLVQEMGPYQVLPLTDWALSSKHSQVSLGEWNPCCWAHANHPFSHHGHFVQESIERWQMWLWKRLNGIHTMDHLIYLIIKILLYWSQCLMGIHMEHKHLHIFAYSRDLYILLPQTTLSPIFYSCFFPSPWKITGFRLLMYNLTSRNFSLQAKWKTRCTAQMSAHQKDFPLPLSFGDIEKGCSTIAAHFQVMPSHHVEPPVNQALVFSSSVKRM